jgi:predicted nucleic acid-binding protein
LTRWIIDCSFAAALFLPDKSSTQVQEFFRTAAEQHEFFVPILWWYELANVITIAERRKILKDADIEKILKLFDKFPMKTDISSGLSFVQRVYELSRVYGLSSYDAAYLELAMRLHASIATLDTQLIQAAAASGVKTYR